MPELQGQTCAPSPRFINTVNYIKGCRTADKAERINLFCFRVVLRSEPGADCIRCLDQTEHKGNRQSAQEQERERARTGRKTKGTGKGQS